MNARLKNFIKALLGIKSPNLLEILKKKGLKVGQNFNMREGCIIDYSHAWHISIGDDVTLAPNVHILAHDASTWTHLGYTKIKNTHIGNRVFIGASSIVLPGVKIGDDVIIGAGSVVTKDIPDNSVYVGNPAKFIQKTDVYLALEKEKMHAENCFDRTYSESENVSEEMKNHLIKMVEKHGIAYVQ